MDMLSQLLSQLLRQLEEEIASDAKRYGTSLAELCRKYAARIEDPEGPDLRMPSHKRHDDWDPHLMLENAVLNWGVAARLLRSGEREEAFAYTVAAARAAEILLTWQLIQHDFHLWDNPVRLNAIMGGRAKGARNAKARELAAALLVSESPPGGWKSPTSAAGIVGGMLENTPERGKSKDFPRCVKRWILEGAGVVSEAYEKTREKIPERTR